MLGVYFACAVDGFLSPKAAASYAGTNVEGICPPSFGTDFGEAAEIGGGIDAFCGLGGEGGNT